MVRMTPAKLLETGNILTPPGRVMYPSLFQMSLPRGETDKDAAYAVSNAVSPEDLAATIYRALGIDHEARIPDQQGRPHSIITGGNPITALIS